MYIILGATGHVGSAVAQSLLDQNESVTVLTHDPKKSSEWERKGATVSVVDVRDVEALRNVFKKGKRLFVLNPPAPHRLTQLWRSVRMLPLSWRHCRVGDREGSS
ncbi:hypothetical protein DYBT9623_05329 [Dyadobacter sp. CECT 9623]|uniref:NAD(P)-binding domain-containing protein n=1 Tax=Dyadobacter linearis TaxID=2823330 RepID=A0ABN7RET8_9BACT|nr:hypothetical protein DYBT9623_05329 [Dyadobacter sp. CECT 9623]